MSMTYPGTLFTAPSLLTPDQTEQLRADFKNATGTLVKGLRELKSRPSARAHPAHHAGQQLIAAEIPNRRFSSPAQQPVARQEVFMHQTPAPAHPTHHAIIAPQPKAAPTAPWMAQHDYNTASPLSAHQHVDNQFSAERMPSRASTMLPSKRPDQAVDAESDGDIDPFTLPETLATLTIDDRMARMEELQLESWKVSQSLKRAAIKGIPYLEAEAEIEKEHMDSITRQR